MAAEFPLFSHSKLEWSRRTVSVVLPQKFRAKYLGSRKIDGDIGYDSAKKVLEEVVAVAKEKAARNPYFVSTLYVVDFLMTEEGVDIFGLLGGKTPVSFKTELISYGMQDYTHNRIFSMIQRSEDGSSGSICHIFLCASGKTAFQMTETLAALFEVFREELAAMKSKKLKTVTESVE